MAVSIWLAGSFDNAVWRTIDSHRDRMAPPPILNPFVALFRNISDSRPQTMKRAQTRTLRK